MIKIAYGTVFGGSKALLLICAYCAQGSYKDSQFRHKDCNYDQNPADTTVGPQAPIMNIVSQNDH